MRRIILWASAALAALAWAPLPLLALLTVPAVLAIAGTAATAASHRRAIERARRAHDDTTEQGGTP